MADHDDDALNKNFLLAIIIGLAMIYYVYNYQYQLIALFWRMFKLVQFTGLAGVEKAIQEVVIAVNFLPFIEIDVPNFGFQKGLKYLISVNPDFISKAQVKRFDLYYGVKLRWLFGLIIIYVGWVEFRLQNEPRSHYTTEKIIRSASKVHPHLKRLIPASWYHKVLAAIFGRWFPSLKERAAGENPMDFSHDYNFDDRSDYENRYAMGLSATELLTVTPPIGVTNKEIEADQEMQNKTGLETNFRPICLFYYAKDKANSSKDFCNRTATLTFTRLLTQTKQDPITNSQYIARTFTKSGKLIPLIIFNQKNEQVEVFKTGCGVIKGHRTSTLLNNGEEYFGTENEVRMLFNELENKVLTHLENKIKNALKGVTFNEVLYVLVKDRHAYTTTVIWELMTLIKTRGRVAGNEFTWLMRHDRSLCMVLQSIGRETPFKEAGAAMSHYKCEKSIGFRVTTPMVDLAVEELHEEAERILEAGEKIESLLSTGHKLSDLFSKDSDTKNKKMEDLTNSILKKNGISEGIDKVYFDPYSEVKELMKLYDEDSPIDSNNS